MKHMHWWTLGAGLLIGYFVLPSVVSTIRSRVS